MIAHRKKWGKSIPEKKTSFYQSRRVLWTSKITYFSEQGLQTSLAVHLHPEEDRVFTTRESARIMTLPEDYKLTGTLNQNLARIGLMVAPLCMKYLADNIYQNILKPYGEVQMKKIVVDKDLGEKETFDKWNGKFLDETSYDTVHHVTEDTGIMKPIQSLDGSDVPLAYVITNAYGDDSVRNTLMTIEDVSVMRANCSGFPYIRRRYVKKGLKLNVDYRLRTPNSYQLKTKSGKWGMIAYSNEINSVMIGYKRGRFTGAIDSSGWVKDNPKKWEEVTSHLTLERTCI